MVEQPNWSRWFSEFDPPQDIKEISKIREAGEKAQKEVERSLKYLEDDDSHSAREISDITSEMGTMADTIEQLAEAGQDAVIKYGKVVEENEILQEIISPLLTMLGAVVIHEEKIDDTRNGVLRWCAENLKDNYQAFFYDKKNKTYVKTAYGYRPNWVESETVLIVPSSDSDRVLIKLRWG